MLGRRRLGRLVVHGDFGEVSSVSAAGAPKIATLGGALDRRNGDTGE